MLCIWVEIYLRTGEWMWRFDAEYKQKRIHGQNVEGVMMDRMISRKLKGKVMGFCVVLASTNMDSVLASHTL